MFQKRMLQPIETVIESQLARHYTPAAVRAILAYIHDDFRVYAPNFDPISAEFAEEPTLTDTNSTLLCLHCAVRASPNRGGGDEIRSLFVRIVFPSNFPQLPPHVVVVPPVGVTVAASHPLIAVNGVVRLNRLPSLVQMRESPTYSLMMILLALGAELGNPFGVPESVERAAVQVHRCLLSYSNHYLRIRLEAERRHRPALRWSSTSLDKQIQDAEEHLRVRQRQEEALTNLLASLAKQTNPPASLHDWLVLDADQAEAAQLSVNCELEAIESVLTSLNPEQDSAAFVSLSKRQFLLRHQLSHRAATLRASPNAPVAASSPMAATVPAAANSFASLCAEFPDRNEEEIRFYYEAAEFSVTKCRELLGK